ncbi:MAG: MHYT domain-containing protein [Rhizobiaceae bacterium]
MIEHAHNHFLVLASLLVAMMAGFTGLSLLKGASELAGRNRKVRIVLAALAMGGGVWSMHFVAMLGLQLQTPFFYDPLTTMASALIAILVVGLALLILHFKTRSNATMASAGILVGGGILAMHYLGMSGIRLVLPVSPLPGVIIAIIVSVGLSVATIFFAYSQRTNRNIVLGTIGFGIAVFAVHFTAMFGTHFIVDETATAGGLLISNEALALGVACAAFVICGGFLLTGTTFLTAADAETEPAIPVSPIAATQIQSMPTSESREDDADLTQPLRLPYEKNNRTFFAEPSSIAAIRAEGHYSILYAEQEKLFCPWPISQISKRMIGDEFLVAHRSYLINPAHVSSFERKKDNGVCYFEAFQSLDKVPVSRSRLAEIRDALGLG